jgi:hypothetical protein
MTIQSPLARIEYTVSGASPYSIPFMFIDDADIKAYADGNLLLLGVDYTLAGAKVATGGTLTLVSPVAGDELVIINDPEPTQLTEYPEFGKFSAGQHELALDKLTILIKRAIDLASRAVRFPDSSVVVGEIAPEANKYIGWDSTGKQLVNLSGSGDATDSIFVIHTPSVTGGVGATVKAKLEEFPGVTDLGAEGDGATNNYLALVAAFAGFPGKKIRVPAGVYQVPFSTLNAITPGAYTCLEGDGADVTELVFIPSDTTTRTVFNVTQPGFTIRGIKVSLQVPAGGTCLAFTAGASGMTIDKCIIDGKCTNVGASISHVSHGIAIPLSGTLESLTVMDSEFTRLRYPLLKANASTAINIGTTFRNNLFRGNYNEDLSFNSPAGSWSDVKVIGNRFCEGAGAGASVNQLYVSFASVSDFVVSGNSFTGNVLDAIHIEENCLRWAVTGNTINVDGNGVFFVENNVGGSYLMPKLGIVADNIVSKAGTLKTAGIHGIWSANSGDVNTVALKQSTITGNVVSGYDYGIVSDGTLNDSLLISSNVIDNCNIGVYSPYMSISISGNITSNCGIGASAQFGGELLDHTFTDCTQIVTCGTTRPIALINPAWTFTEFALSAGVSSYKALAQLLTLARAYGHLHVSEWCEVVSDVSTESYEVTWNGSALTATSKASYEPGGVSCTVVMNSNNLAVQVFCASARTTVRLSAKFNGMLTVTAT